MDFKTAYSIIFDCDGVILDSNAMKTQAFGDTLLQMGIQPHLRDSFIAYHTANGGVSRYAKFKHFFTNMFPSPEPDAQAETALSIYGKMCRERLMTCHLLPGVHNFLRQAQQHEISCYIVSGGDEAELNNVFSTRGLSKFFKKILGSPVHKIDNLEALFKEGLVSEKSIFFGDSKLDMECAKAFGIKFVYIGCVSEWKNGAEETRKQGFETYVDFQKLTL
jgi:phosphoglycolate phosphatase-like HAD superfamily hydrolase